MMEPRSTLHSTMVLRQDSALARERPIGLEQDLQRYYPEPGIPIHPALEYEIYADYDDDDDDSSTIERGGGEDADDPVMNDVRRRRKRRRRIKLVLSSAVLIVSGVGTVVAAKLQAIPM
jgi:hypothetical protein